MKIVVTPIAKTVPYDDTIAAPLTGSENVQEIADYLKGQIAVSASPGFTWSRSGTIPASTWLQNDSVPSNLSGRTVFLTGASILSMYVANQDATSNIIIDVYQHDGDGLNMVLVGSVTTLAQRSNTFSVSWSITKGKQLALQLNASSASAKNIVVGALIKGNI